MSGQRCIKELKIQVVKKVTDQEHSLTSFLNDWLLVATR